MLLKVLRLVLLTLEDLRKAINLEGNLLQKLGAHSFHRIKFFDNSKFSGTIIRSMIF